MSLYSGQITQLLQGVSQQHPKDRAEGQIGEQVNCVSDVVQGLRRRPAAQVLAELSGISTSFTLDEHTAVYSYERGNGEEKYIVLIDTDGEIKVYDAVTGAEKTVTNTANKAYLVCDDPVSELRFHTIADTTFILNTTKTVTDTDQSNYKSAEHMFWASQVGFGRTYRIGDETSGATIAKCTTPSTVTITATTVDKRLTLSTQDLLKCLYDGTAPTGWSALDDLTNTTNWFRKASWTVTLEEGYIRMVRASYYLPVYFDFEVSDTNNGNDLKQMSYSVSSYEDLPPIAKYGTVAQITGSGDEEVDDYWVVYTPSGGWQETYKPNVTNPRTLTANTMPSKLVRESDGTFTHLANSWRTKDTGDATTNPMPSFVDNTCQDIGSYQNRLYLLTGENVCMTRAFTRDDWFAESVAAPSDDDPIDSSSSDSQVTDLLYGLVFNGSLILFSNNTQFIHPKDQAVTPGTFAVASDTKFNVSPYVRPIATGLSILFPTVSGDYTNMWDYRMDTLTGNPRCESITKHVSRYIAGNPVQLQGNTNSDYIFVRTDDDPTAIYVLQTYIKEEKQAQLAWHRWELSNCDEVINMTLLGAKLYLLTRRNTDDIFLETIDLAMPLTDSSNFELFLDHHYVDQVTTGAYEIDDVPYTARVALHEDDIDYFVQGKDCTNEGFKITDYAIDSGYVYFNSPEDSYVIQGYPFESSGTLTSPYIVDQKGRPYTKQTIIDDINVNLQDTGYVNFCIAHKAGVDYEQAFSGIVLNNWQYQIGVASLFDTDVYIPVRDYRELIDIKFDSSHHLGFSLMSYEWAGRMESRGRRSQ